MHDEISIQLRLLPLQHNFTSVQLSHCFFLSPHCHQNTLILKQNLLITQNPEAEHRTCIALHKTQRAIQKQVH